MRRLRKGEALAVRATHGPRAKTARKNGRHKQKGDAVQSVAGSVDTVDRESEIGRPAD
jgi:hypothetical protein